MVIGTFLFCFLGELPEAEELMAAYETQKVVIAQLQEQIYDEKMRNTEIEGIWDCAEHPPPVRLAMKPPFPSIPPGPPPVDM